MDVDREAIEDDLPPSVGERLAQLGLTRHVLLRITAAATVAFVLFAAYTVTRPRQTEVDTTVFVARVLPGGTSGDVDASIADFQTVIGLPIVVDQVAKDTGVSASRLADLAVQRIQTSSAVRVSFTDKDAALATTVVTTAARQALRTLAQQQVDGATEAADSARTASDAALKDLTDFEQGLGVVDFQNEYQSRRSDLLNLQAQEASAPSAALNSLIAERTAEVDKLAAAQPQYNQLSDRLNAARSAVADASNALTIAQGKLSAADASSVLTEPHTATIARTLPALQAGLLAFALVFAMGVGLALLDTARRRRLQEPYGQGATAAPTPRDAAPSNASALGPLLPDEPPSVAGRRANDGAGSTRRRTVTDKRLAAKAKWKARREAVDEELNG